MPRIEVVPEQLHAAGGGAGEIAGELTELRGQVQALGSRAAAAGLGSNTDAAANAYTGTDTHAIPEGP